MREFVDLQKCTKPLALDLNLKSLTKQKRRNHAYRMTDSPHQHAKERIFGAKDFNFLAHNPKSLLLFRLCMTRHLE